MILVSVQRAEDVRLAKALLGALGDRLDFFLLFQRRELARLFGEPRCPVGFDAATCLLNAQNFELVVSFSGARDPRFAWNLLLLSFFDEVGIATLEIQSELGQPGFGPRGGRGLEIGYAARTLLGWAGPEGVGYLPSELPIEVLSWEPYVLITGPEQAAPDQAQYQFAIAVAKLAASRPELRFVWKPAPAEELEAAPGSMTTMVEAYGLANLSVERGLPLESLAAACSAGISGASTALLEYELRGKPALLHEAACAQLAPGARGFATAAELERAFEALLAAPAQHRVHTGVGRLNVERLEQHLRQAAQRSALSSAWLPRALDRLPGLRAAEASVSLDSQRLASELERVIERIGVLHRSTLAYKAKKLAARVRKGWTRD